MGENKEEINRIRPESVPQFLVDTGLLFEINRKVLHPLGLALEVILDDETRRAKQFGGLWDYRHDPEGMRFTDEGFDESMEKLNAFMNELGTDKLSERKRLLGYVVQGDE